MFEVRLIKSMARANKKQRATLEALGFRKIGHTRLVKDTPAQRGQMFKLQRFLKVQRAESKS